MNHGQSTNGVLVESGRAHLSLFFHPISELCAHGLVFESILNVLQGVRMLVSLHFVVAQRELFETAGERGWRERAVVWRERMERVWGRLQGPYPYLIVSKINAMAY
jgi:hypothetical protein